METERRREVRERDMEGCDSVESTRKTFLNASQQLGIIEADAEVTHFPFLV